MAGPISTTFEGVSHDAYTFSSAITEFFRTLLGAQRPLYRRSSAARLADLVDVVDLFLVNT